MIKTSKRMLSLLIVLALVLAIAPMAVFAADGDVTVYVQPNSNWLTDGARVAVYCYDGVGGETWVDATDADGDGIYEAVIPAGYSNIIFCRMNPATTENSWANKWNQTIDLTVPTDENNCYVVVGWDKGAGQWTTVGGEVEPIPMAYHIVGSMNGWAAAESNKMTANDDGTYSITMELTAGDYEYKVTTSDGQWSADPNMTVSVATDCAVTFTLTLAEADSLNGCTVVATGDGIGGEVVDPVDPVVNYYVAGDEALTGYAWDAAGAVMTASEDGTYTATFAAVAAGAYEFKITDGTWDNSWGKDGGNYKITVEAEGDVTITFDPADGSVSYTGAIETPAAPLSWGYINVVGNGSGNWLNGQEWNVDSWVNGLEPAVDGTMLTTWSKTYTGVAAGSYEFKLAADSAWDITWATGEAMESGLVYEAWFAPMGNSSFVVAEDNSNVTIVLDTTNMDPVTGEGATLCVTVEAVASAVVPEEVVIGENNYTVVDANIAAGTFTATETGILTIDPTSIVVEGEALPVGMFGRGMFAIAVNGEVYANQTSVNVEVKAGQTYEIGLVNNAGAVADITLTLAMDAYDVKWQITAGTTAESASTNLRLITYAESLDYASIVVSVTVGGNTVEYTCTDVYGTINADGVSISNPGNVFEGANYFVTFTLDNVPAAAFDSEIVVSVAWENLDGTYVFGNSRTIVISEDF